jgi:cytochrome P450
MRLLHALLYQPLEICCQQDFELPIHARKTAFFKRLLLNNPEAIRHVFFENAKNYQKNKLLLRLLKPALGRGLLSTIGEDWRRQRRILAPLFSAKQIQSFGAAQAWVASQAVLRLKNVPDGSVLDVAAEMSRLTLEVLEHTLFSQGFGDDSSAFKLALGRYFETFGRHDLFDVFGLPDFLPRLNRLRGRADKQTFDQVLSNIVATRRALIAAGKAPPHDLLSLLLKAQDAETGRQISDAELRDNMVTFIGAGHETTSSALTWVFYLLSQAPDWRLRVEQEIDAIVDMTDPASAMPITKAVIEEAMRLYPPVPIISRVALQDDVICGHKIKAGMVVTVSPYVLHRHQTLWDSPELFNPARFLGENRNNINKFAYLPFGVGQHLCVGMGFAMSEMLHLVAKLLAAYRFELAPNHAVVPEVRVVLRAKNGMKMTLHQR